jgi:hypothetical protein
MDTVEMFILTASNAFVLMIKALNLHDLVETNPYLADLLQRGCWCFPRDK